MVIGVNITVVIKEMVAYFYILGTQFFFIIRDTSTASMTWVMSMHE
jgi:hypothetical protein